MKITEWLAIYGAVLSSIIFIWNIIQSRPRIEVEVVFGMGGVYIFVRNLSAHVVNLAAISIMHRYNKDITLKDKVLHFIKYRRWPVRLGWVSSSLSIYKLSDGCPLSLAARDSHKVFVPNNILLDIFEKSDSKEIIAVVQDKVWNNVYSKIFKYE
ncbi:hypothetical protein [Neisseria wadsworthii]|uniref:hypothetical protein n=1 Tax=Neisseria wadsworthii TaxID=607711 RepID=UPI00131E88F9|nr:hypothetical protein [Neisseria wadsworthii]